MAGAKPGKNGSVRRTEKRVALSEKEELRTIRDRLYSRAEQPKPWERHTLSGRTPRAPRAAAPEAAPRRIDEQVAPPPPSRTPELAHDVVRSGIAVTTPPTIETMAQTPKDKKIVLNGYRAKIIAIGILFFVVALALSSSFLFFGQNTISGDNIEVKVAAPFAVGAGAELSLTASITNKNAVPVESATLIVEYPPGTQEAATAGKELFRDRISLGSIKPGELLTIPVKAKLFGEENDEKTVNISVEYRVEGSNATFYKDADPVKVKISSSPVVLSISGVSEISSGQEVALTLTLTSNSPTPLHDLLVQAEYPVGFDFSESSPKPAKGQTVWTVGSLEPGGKTEIQVKGAMTGGSAEERTFKFSVGVPNERDRFSLASVLTTIATGVQLTDPFVGLEVVMDGKKDKTIAVAPDDSVAVTIRFKNTLSDTIYDATVKAKLSGSGLSADNVNTSDGFYDSTANTITWDKQSVPDLAELSPGEEETVNFVIRGANLDAMRTPQVSFDVSVTGRRVSEDRVPQELTNIESRTIRFRSVTALSSYGLYSEGPFANTGPIPPRAESQTTYTIMLDAKNGSNELADTTVTMTLPAYVSWLSAVASGAAVNYNAATREVTWKIGNLDANGSSGAAFQVSFLPSVSHVGTVPVLVGEQYLKATDRFTGSVVRATAPAVTTHIPQDPDPKAQEGRVQPK
jgi:hypothetical protein